MFFMRTRNEDGTLNNIEIQVVFRLNRTFHGFFNFGTDKLLSEGKSVNFAGKSAFKLAKFESEERRYSFSKWDTNLRLPPSPPPPLHKRLYISATLRSYIYRRITFKLGLI